MKKLFFSGILVFTTSTTLQADPCYCIESFVSSLKTKFLENNVYVHNFSESIDQETATKINEFVLKRKGIVSCVTDVTNKTITITSEPHVQKESIDGLFNIIEHRFLEKD